MYGLELQLKGGRKHLFSIDIFPVSIGSDEDADIQVPHKTVAGKHARIVKEGGRFLAVNLDTGPGTFINGEPVRRALLRPGDTLRVGAAVFRFVAPGEGPEELVMPGASRETDPEEPQEGTKPSVRDPYREQFKRQSPSPSRSTIDPGTSDHYRTDPKPGSIRVRQRLLQFNKIDPDEDRSFLKSEYAQFGGGQRFLFVAILLVICAGIFRLCQWLAGM